MLIFSVLFSVSANCATLPAPEEPSFNKKAQIVCEKITKEAFYLGVGVAFTSASLLARLAWEVSLIFPGGSKIGNECLLFNHLSGAAAQYAFKQMAREFDHFEKIPLSLHSWHLNQALLSQIEASSSEEKELLHFLKNRWLAKSTGFAPSMIEWMYPCFGINLQVHPKTTHSYARNPSVGLSQTYQNIVESWKQLLPHPIDYPLILTRPFDVRDYLPSCLSVPLGEKVETTVEKLGPRRIVDLTDALPDHQRWAEYRKQFSDSCRAHQIDPSEVVCVQRVCEGEIGGLRLLPLSSSAEETKRQHQFLLEWISCYGLTANRIELDRWPVEHSPVLGQPPLRFLSKEAFVSFIDSFTWTSGHPPKNLMVQGTLQVIKGLLANLSQKKWNEILKNPTKISVAQIAFSKIKQQFELLSGEKEDSSLFDTVAHLELIHADLSSLLEIFSLFTLDDFPKIYRDILSSVPAGLKPLTSYGIHSSGMTSFTGILRAVEKSLDRAPRILYGKNIYFESALALQKRTSSADIEEAKEDDWKEVDLIFGQFNPVLKRIDLQPTEYQVEKIGETLHRVFNTGRIKPLTLALDCTLDFINSPRVQQLLSDFQKEIEDGRLNIICYRSGLKFDLFGMDNYCGAPIYMIHNKDVKWSHFDTLLNDPVLQADRLSLNWFCLAYQNATLQLELYRKQIFKNTQALLNKIPPGLFSNGNYRVIHVEPGADPAFIDIKVFGPLHQVRSAVLVSGCLYVHAMAGGHPIFTRPSLGFYHPNFTMLFTDEYSTIRLTVGLDPAQVDVLARCFAMIDTLNGAPGETLLNLLTSP
jgi:hypothetical protein